jgi:hypothetical protein
MYLAQLYTTKTIILTLLVFKACGTFLKQTIGQISDALSDLIALILLTSFTGPANIRDGGKTVHVVFSAAVT